MKIVAMPENGPRRSGRMANQLRHVSIEPNINRYAEGSCMVAFGHTKVMVTASVEESVPSFMRGKGEGWITAEYGMLPRSTHTRSGREAAKGKQTGRTQEIQRLIGRSIRASVDMKAMGERSILIDCDVVQADGGTRTASITGAYVAVALALKKLVASGKLAALPIKTGVAAVSCGMVEGVPVLDLDYEEDSACGADVNFVLTHDGRMIEVQGTAEGEPFSQENFDALRLLAIEGVKELAKLQKAALDAA